MGPFRRKSNSTTQKVKNFLARNQDAWGSYRELIRRGKQEGIWAQATTPNGIELTLERLLFEDKQDGNIRAIAAQPKASSHSQQHT